MAKTTLRRIIDQVTDEVEEIYPDRPSLLFDILFVILTGELPPKDNGSLIRLTKSKNHARAVKPFEALRDFVQHYPIAQAVCARYQYGQPQSRVLKEWKVNPSDWKLVHTLARDIGFGGLESFITGTPFPFRHFEWHDQFEEERIYLNVLFDPRAIEDMLISAQEAYFARGPRQKAAHEVYGVMLGMRRDMPFKDKNAGNLTVRFVHIMRCQPQLTAKASPANVTPNAYSLEALSNLALTQFPQYEIIGDFHSHPWNTWKSLERYRGWELSEPDQSSTRNWLEYLHRKGSLDRPQVSFIIALAKGKPYKGRPLRFHKMENTLQYTIGTGDKSCRVLIAGYRILESGRCTHKNISLQPPGVFQQ